MKNYVIVLEPEKEIKEKVESFRLGKTGQKMVDSFPPHVTLKRRFALKDGFSEEDIIRAIDNFEMPKIEVAFDAVKKFGDAVVLTSSGNEELKQYHKKFIDALDPYADTIGSDFEGDNFKSHLTLYRSSEEVDVDFSLDKFRLETINFYELDPTINRSFANLVYSRNL